MPKLILVNKDLNSSKQNTNLNLGFVSSINSLTSGKKQSYASFPSSSPSLASSLRRKKVCRFSV